MTGQIAVFPAASVTLGRDNEGSRDEGLFFEEVNASPLPSPVGVAVFIGAKVTLGRQPNNDGDKSGAMWFE